MPVKQEHTFEAVVWVAKYVKGMIKREGANNVEGSNNNNISKKKKYSKSSNEFVSNQEGKWCDHCNKRHSGDCAIC